ncbi:SPW repeat protein [Arenibaculum pallidiluteum]|uniref:SPW repeat protein n=1 Tax=Arenibaculum pallidiluteum TaxID=2812559 RepID=UPI001A969E1A|nr:SPW repeat protein [Arenibaculum pallidiluteum]
MSLLERRREESVIDVLNAVLALVLFCAPWVFGFAGQSAAAWNAWLTAVVIGGIAVAAVFAFATWEEWANLVLGLWAVVSPWVLGFAGLPAAMWSHVGVGVGVAALAAIELWLTRHPPRVAA